MLWLAIAVNWLNNIKQIHWICIMLFSQFTAIFNHKMYNFTKIRTKHKKQPGQEKTTIFGKLTEILEEWISIWNHSSSIRSFQIKKTVVSYLGQKNFKNQQRALYSRICCWHSHVLPVYEILNFNREMYSWYISGNIKNLNFMFEKNLKCCIFRSGGIWNKF